MHSSCASTTLSSANSSAKDTCQSKRQITKMDLGMNIVTSQCHAFSCIFARFRYFSVKDRQGGVSSELKFLSPSSSRTQDISLRKNCSVSSQEEIDVMLKRLNSVQYSSVRQGPERVHRHLSSKMSIVFATYLRAICSEKQSLLVLRW